MPYIANPLEGLPIRNSFITDQANLGAAAALDDTIIIYDISSTALKQLTIANLQAGILVSPAFTGNPTAPTQSAGNDTTRLATTAFVTAATSALNTVGEMTDVTITSIASGEVLKWNGSAWVNNTLAEANILTVAGPTFTGVLTVGSAVISEADLEQIDDLTAGTAVASKALVVDSNKDIGTIRNLTIDGVFTDGNYTFATDGSVTGLGAITSTGVVTATGFTIGSAVIAEAELEMIDGITAGTAAASKALVLDSNKDIGTIRNLTIDGTFSDGNYTFDTSGNVTGLGTIGSGNITSTGTVQGTTITATTAFVPDASDGAALGTSALEFSDLFLADGAVLSLGDHQDITFTHVHNTGVLLNSSSKLQFGDSGTFIHQSSNGTLTIESDSTVDINGAVAFDGALTGITDITLSGALSDGNYTFATDGSVTGLGTVASGTHTIGSLVVAAASITDTSGAISFGDENLTTTGVVTAGGITLGSAVLIEAELEMLDGITAGTAAASKALVLDGSKNIATIGTIGSGVITATGTSVFSGLDVNGDVDISGDLTLSAGADGGLRFSVASSVKMLDNDAASLVFEEADNAYMTFVTTNSSEAVKFDKALDINAAIQSDSTITVGVDGTGYDVKFFGATSGAYMLWDENVDDLILAGAAQIIVPVGQLVLGSTAMTSTAAELNVLDGVTLGTAIASKGVTTDASIDTTGQRNLTITGELDAATLDISGAVDIDGAVDIAGVTDFHASIDMNSQDIDNIKSATFIAVVDNGNSGSAKTIDWGAGQKQKVTMTANCTFTFTAPDGPCNLMLILIQDGGGTNTAVWTGGSTNVDFPAATVPTLTTTGDAVDVIAFFYDGTNANGTYYAQATLAFG